CDSYDERVRSARYGGYMKKLVIGIIVVLAIVTFIRDFSVSPRQVVAQDVGQTMQSSMGTIVTN
ncbi:MAG TPA: hypothetical protein PLW80_10075, partial [Spirochaetales bacterium]|nr:hypothetical protein [Spirochaetales bacterium]